MRKCGYWWGRGGGGGIQCQFYVGLHTDYPLSLCCSKYYIWYLSKYYIDGWLASLLAGFHCMACLAVISPNTARPYSLQSICNISHRLNMLYILGTWSCLQPIIITPAHTHSQPQLIASSSQHLSLLSLTPHTSHLSPLLCCRLRSSEPRRRRRRWRLS